VRERCILSRNSNNIYLHKTSRVREIYIS
jgi:hypothetical protein